MLLVPAGQTNLDVLKSVRDETINALTRAVRGTTQNQALIYRDLIEQDLLPNSTAGEINSRFSNQSALVANTPGSLYQQTLPNYQAIGLYGYASLAPSPLISMIQFKQGTAVLLAQYFLDALYADSSEVVGYFDTPIIYQPSQTASILAVASAAVGAAAENFVLLGIVVEPSGQSIQPPNVG